MTHLLRLATLVVALAVLAAPAGARTVRLDRQLRTVSTTSAFAPVSDGAHLVVYGSPARPTVLDIRTGRTRRVAGGCGTAWPGGLLAAAGHLLVDCRGIPEDDLDQYRVVDLRTGAVHDLPFVASPYPRGGGGFYGAQWLAMGDRWLAGDSPDACLMDWRTGQTRRSPCGRDGPLGRVDLDAPRLRERCPQPAHAERAFAFDGSWRLVRAAGGAGMTAVHCGAHHRRVAITRRFSVDGRMEHGVAVYDHGILGHAGHRVVRRVGAVDLRTGVRRSWRLVGDEDVVCGLETPTIQPLASAVLVSRMVLADYSTSVCVPDRYSVRVALLGPRR
jgi:hypothetical protein